MDAELEGAEKLDESEISKVLSGIEVDAELVFFLSSMEVFEIEDEAKMMLVEEVDFGFEIDGALGGVQLFKISKDLKFLFVEIHRIFPGEIAAEFQPFIEAHLPEEIVSDRLIEDIDDVVLLVLVFDDKMNEVIHPLLNLFLVVG
jgi:hypothetical protein